MRIMLVVFQQVGLRILDMIPMAMYPVEGSQHLTTLMLLRQYSVLLERRRNVQSFRREKVCCVNVLLG